MPRIQVSPREVDKTLAIEDAIGRVLRDETIARISTSSIAKEYDVLDANGDPVTCSLEEKCGFLAKKFEVTFEIKDGDVWLRKPHSTLKRKAK